LDAEGWGDAPILEKNARFAHDGTCLASPHFPLTSFTYSILINTSMIRFYMKKMNVDKFIPTTRSEFR
jgi:hypothetical protein